MSEWVNRRDRDSQTDKRNRFSVSLLRIEAVEEEEEEEGVYFPSPFLVNFSKTEDFFHQGSSVTKFYI